MNDNHIAGHVDVLNGERIAIVSAAGCITPQQVQASREQVEVLFHHTTEDAAIVFDCRDCTSTFTDLMDVLKQSQVEFDQHHADNRLILFVGTHTFIDEYIRALMIGYPADHGIIIFDDTERALAFAREELKAGD